MADVTLLVAFLGGLVSFLSPCILPLIPAYLTFLAGSTFKEVEQNIAGARTRIFIASVFFVIGFSLVFSVVGVLFQSVLATVAYDARILLSQVGGLVIIFFGLVLMGIIKIPVLQAEHKLKVKPTPLPYLTSFLFGAAFAVGWTPCVGAVLGGVLTLAVTQPAAALPLMLAYSLGLGIPFLLVGAFVSQSAGLINKISPHLWLLNIIFGIVLVVLGILVFTNTLSLIASHPLASAFLLG